MKKAQSKHLHVTTCVCLNCLRYIFVMFSWYFGCLHVKTCVGTCMMILASHLLCCETGTRLCPLCHCWAGQRIPPLCGFFALTVQRCYNDFALAHAAQRMGCQVFQPFANFVTNQLLRIYVLLCTRLTLAEQRFSTKLTAANLCSSLHEVDRCRAKNFAKSCLLQI